jgi:hypothetical protein
MSQGTLCLVFEFSELGAWGLWLHVGSLPLYVNVINCYDSFWESFYLATFVTTFTLVQYAISHNTSLKFQVPGTTVPGTRYYNSADSGHRTPEWVIVSTGVLYVVGGVPETRAEVRPSVCHPMADDLSRFPIIGTSLVVSYTEVWFHRSTVLLWGHLWKWVARFFLIRLSR